MYHERYTDDPNKGPVPDAFTPVFEQQAVLTQRPQSLETGPEDGTVLTKRPRCLETSEADPIVQDLSRPVDDLVFDWKEPNKGSKRPRDIPPNFWACFGPSERKKE